MARAAVESALLQTHAPIEIIVIIDGPETRAIAGENHSPQAATPTPAGEKPTTPAEIPANTGEISPTAALLSQLTDPRVRVIHLPESVGGSEARNTGTRAAIGDWIAFLDDDDLWLPTKLAVQLAAAAALPKDKVPVLSSPVLARSPIWEEIWPRVRYRPSQNMAEYLFCRKGLRYGSALLQTSTLLIPRALLLRCPFTPGLKKHQDWDWLLRASAEPEVAVICVGEQPLAIFHVEGDRSSVGRTRDWRFSLAWAQERRQFFTARAWTGFLVTECAAQASTWRDRLGVFAALLRHIFAGGLPMPGELLRLACFLLLPQNMRRAVREHLRALRFSRIELVVSPAQRR